MRWPPSHGALLALAIAIGGCSADYGGPIGYEKAGSPDWGPSFGYSDKKIGEDEYSVVVTGNPQTSRKRVADIALLRAARLAQEHHSDSFIIRNQATESLLEHQIVSAPIGGLLVWLPVGETPTQEPRAILIIHLLPPGAPAPANALNAAQVIAEVTPRLTHR